MARYEDDFSHEQKTSFKQYLTDARKEDAADVDDDTIARSQIKFSLIEGNNTCCINIGYCGRDGVLVLSECEIKELLQLSEGESLTLNKNEDYYIQMNMNVLLFDSGINGNYFRVEISDLIR